MTTEIGSKLLQAAGACYRAVHAIREREYEHADEAVFEAIRILRQYGHGSPQWRLSLDLTPVPVGREWLEVTDGDIAEAIQTLLQVGRACTDLAKPRIEE